MAFPSIRNIDPFPQRDGSQTPAQFSAAVDNVFSSIDGMISDLNAFGDYADDIGEENQGYADASAASASSASNSALNASRDAAQAAASANYKGNWASLSGSLSKPASVFHAGEYWLLNNNLSNVAASTPSDANADWQKIQTYQAWGLGVFPQNLSSTVDFSDLSKSTTFIGWPSSSSAPASAPLANGSVGVRMSTLSTRYADFIVAVQGASARAFVQATDGGTVSDWNELKTGSLTVVSTSGDIVRTGAQTEVVVDTGVDVTLNLVASDFSPDDEIVITKLRQPKNLTITSDANIALPDNADGSSHTLSEGYAGVIKIIKRGSNFRLSIS